MYDLLGFMRVVMRETDLSRSRCVTNCRMDDSTWVVALN